MPSGFEAEFGSGESQFAEAVYRFGECGDGFFAVGLFGFGFLRRGRHGHGFCFVKQARIKALEQGVTLVRFALKFGVELARDEERVVF